MLFERVIQLALTYLTKWTEFRHYCSFNISSKVTHWSRDFTRREPSLAALWDLNDGDGAVARDAVHGVELHLTNSSAWQASDSLLHAQLNSTQFSETHLFTTDALDLQAAEVRPYA